MTTEQYFDDTNEDYGTYSELLEPKEREEWRCFECGLKYYYSEPAIIDGLEYCIDCRDDKDGEL